MSNIYVLTSVGYGLYMALIYVVSSLFGMEGTNLWIFRGAAALLGMLVSVSFLYYQIVYIRGAMGGFSGGGGGRSGRRAKEPKGDGSESDIDILIREASAKLVTSQLGDKATVRTLPVVLVVGPKGGAKTCSVVNSGLHPELLAGQVYEENNVLPTGTANFWFARNAVFVEAAGKLLDSAKSWQRLLKKVKPAALRSLFSSNREAPRAALVCVSIEEFLKAGSTDSLAALARNVRGRLEQASKTFGARLPVYVLFTKTDRIAFFTEYVRNLKPDEVGKVVGATIPVEPDEAEGVYAERQAKRLSEYFNRLFRTLCDRRPDFLIREHDEQNLGAIYEFPRELRKLRSMVVQFLVDLGRPSQLRAGPFLRGFYFSGVRPILTKEMAERAPRAARHADDDDISVATQAFNLEQMMADQGAPEEHAAVSRKVPQWVFLSHLFHDVLLGDKAAMGASGSAAKFGRWRNILLAMGSVLLLIWMVGMTVSYFGNRALEREVLEAAKGIGAAEAAGGELASLDSLQRLEVLRQALDRLTRYEREGVPMRLRWGLYVGDRLYPPTRSAYYRRFHQLLFASSQASLLATLQRLPPKPAPTDEYSPIYNTLKAYLITTSHPDKSTAEFLTPVLMLHWMANRPVDQDRQDLAKLQFDFYAEDLKIANPFSSDQDGPAIARGRAYLLAFAGIERVYRFMLNEASKNNEPVNFNERFPGSDRVVINRREVAGAFTKGGWEFMQDAIRNADRFYGGEEWVLGQRVSETLDPVQLEGELAKRYLTDFLKEWQEYLQATNVVRYANLSDAASKLTQLSGNQSPLLAVLWLASQHTSVESEEVKQAFQPVQYVVPPESQDRFIGDSNNGYMNSLVGLQASVEMAANASGPGRDSAVNQITNDATRAKVVTRQVAQNFRIDPEVRVGPTTQEIMEKPILYAEALVRSLGPAELNAKGRSLCSQLQALMQKYPFKSNATAEATLAEVAALFQPGTGLFWNFYAQDLSDHLLRQGGLYAANPNSRIRLNPEFVNFFNRAAAFSEAVYPDGGSEARLNYIVSLYRPEGMQRLSLIVDNQMLTAGDGGPAKLSFFWPGAGAQQVRLQGRFGGSPDLTFAQYQGLWAVFRFFGDADRSRTSGRITTLEWVPRQGQAGQPMTLPDGTPLTVRFDVECAAPVFQKGYFDGLGCVSLVAR